MTIIVMVKLEDFDTDECHLSHDQSFGETLQRMSVNHAKLCFSIQYGNDTNPAFLQHLSAIDSMMCDLFGRSIMFWPPL